MKKKQVLSQFYASSCVIIFKYMFNQIIKPMKKVFAFLAAAVLFAGMANAQLSINGGLATQMKTSTGTLPLLGTYTARDTNMTGFFLGVSYNLPITGGLSVAPGIYYQNLSHSTATDVIIGTLHTKSVEQAIAIPILFNYGVEISDGVKLFGFVGPNITYGLVKTGTSWLGDTEPADPTLDYYGGDDPEYSQLNIFGTIGAGLQYHSLRFQLGYQMGFMDRTTADNTTEKVNNFFVGVGYAL